MQLELSKLFESVLNKMLQLPPSAYLTRHVSESNVYVSSELAWLPDKVILYIVAN